MLKLCIDKVGFNGGKKVEKYSRLMMSRL